MLFEDSSENKEFIKYGVNFLKKPLYVNMAISAILCFESSCFLILKLVHKETDDILFSAFYTTLFLIYTTWTWSSFAYEIKEKRHRLY